MTVIVTMAGSGKRFRMAGYQVPKYMIRARGKTLFEWSILSLGNFRDHHLIFACLAEHDTQWIQRAAESLGFKHVSIMPRNSVSSGQAETAYDVIQLAAKDESLWIYNIDTYIETGIHPSDMTEKQGCVHVFQSSDPGMSYVRYSNIGNVVELAEKKVISKWATVGSYGFSSAALYRELYQDAYVAGEVGEVRGERYVAPIYQLMINSGKPVCAPRLRLANVHILGTPYDVLRFDPLARPPSGSD